MPGSDVERRDGDDAHPVHVAITDGAVDWTFAQGTMRARAYRGLASPRGISLTCLTETRPGHRV